MRRRIRIAVALGALGAALALSGRAGASSDFSCYPEWSLDGADFDCGSSIVLSPGNDTRVNLALLLRDRAGLASRPGTYPTLEWDFSYARNFFDWNLFRETLYPAESVPDNDYYGSRCVSLAGGDAAFAAAVSASGALSAREKEQLSGARGQLKPVCENFGQERWYSQDQAKAPAVAPSWPADVASSAGREFLAYLVSAAAFYGEDWGGARAGFSSLLSAKDPWLKETARYMLARVDLNAAQAASFDEWGFFTGTDATDTTAAASAARALADYLKAYPKGLYAGSAAGLQRRAQWLRGDLSGLAKAYEGLFGRIEPGSAEEALLIDEVDNKLLLAKGAEGAISTPLLLATYDLMRMRGGANLDHGQTPIGEAELKGQARLFSGNKPLHDFLLANHAFYVAGKAQGVLALIPDGSSAARYSALEFSRQMLRGQALAALGDPGEEKFWLGLVHGATGIYQRPSVELGLALHYEKAGQLARVFAPGSPIEDTMIRKILLQKSAGADILRAQARNAERPAPERDLALFTLLHKELTRGRYADFLADVKLVPAGADAQSGLWQLVGSEQVPVGLFTNGTWSEAYACPALGGTVAALARNPQDVKGRLCLGEFYRLNGFDGFYEYDPAEQKGGLGSVANLFPGTAIPRGSFYPAIAADPAAAREDRAYALYRAVMCYAPAGINSCGGDEVDEAGRKAWFQTLKRQYADTRWARELRYYW